MAFIKTAKVFLSRVYKLPSFFFIEILLSHKRENKYVSFVALKILDNKSKFKNRKIFNNLIKRKQNCENLISTFSTYHFFLIIG
jgi:hypothetical protein